MRWLPMSSVVGGSTTRNARNQCRIPPRRQMPRRGRETPACPRRRVWFRSRPSTWRWCYWTSSTIPSRRKSYATPSSWPRGSMYGSALLPSPMLTPTASTPPTSSGCSPWTPGMSTATAPRAKSPDPIRGQLGDDQGSPAVSSGQQQYPRVGAGPHDRTGCRACMGHHARQGQIPEQGTGSLPAPRAGRQADARGRRGRHGARQGRYTNPGLRCLRPPDAPRKRGRPRTTGARDAFIVAAVNLLTRLPAPSPPERLPSWSRRDYAEQGHGLRAICRYVRKLEHGHVVAGGAGTPVVGGGIWPARAAHGRHDDVGDGRAVHPGGG